MSLDIIVPHYNEPLSKCKHFLHMIDAQRGINFQDIRVIVVQDGRAEYGPEFIQYIRNNHWNFTVLVESIKHSGVSVARNLGLKVSHAEWVTFCDCDDTFSGIYSLKQILDLLGSEQADKYDLLWTKFYIEQPRNGAMNVHPSKQNNVFIHGKCFRRSFLEQNNIRFDANLFYSEDSAFCTDVDIAIDHNRVGEIRAEGCLYSWIYYPDSESANPEHTYRNIFGLFLRHRHVIEQFYRHNMMYDFRAMVARTVTDYYYHLARNDTDPQFRNDLYADYARFYADYSAAYHAVTPDVLERCLNATMNEASKSEDYVPPSIPFSEWMMSNIPPKNGGDCNA